MNTYLFPIVCAKCGGDLEHVNGAASAAGTQSTAIARCAPCRTEWQVLVQLRVMQQRWGRDSAVYECTHVRPCPPCRSCYTGGCRCVDCKAAESIYQRERYLHNKATTS